MKRLSTRARQRINVTRCRSPFPLPLLERLSGNATFQRMPRYQAADKRSWGFVFHAITRRSCKRSRSLARERLCIARRGSICRGDKGAGLFLLVTAAAGSRKNKYPAFRPSGSKVRRIVGAFLWRYGAAVDDLIFRMDRGCGLRCGDDTERAFGQGFHRHLGCGVVW